MSINPVYVATFLGAVALTLAAIWPRPVEAPAVTTVVETRSSQPEIQPEIKVTAEAVRRALLEQPEILAEVAQALQAKQEAAQRTSSVGAVAKLKSALFDAGSPFLGNPNGSKVVVEFFDYQCGYCRRSNAVIKEMLVKDPEVKIILKELPILGPNSLAASKAAIAAGLQGRYLEMHEALYAQPLPLDEAKIAKAATEAGLDIERLRADMSSETVAEVIRTSMKLGSGLAIDGTPSFAALGAGVMKGFRDAATFASFLAQAEKP